MFSSPLEPEQPQVLRCRACDVVPGDEVVIVDHAGRHHAVRPEYVVVDPARTAVTLVPRQGAEHRVAYADPVLVIRGGELNRLMPPGV